MEFAEIFKAERGRPRSRPPIATPESPNAVLYKIAIQEREDLRKWVSQLEKQLVGEERRLGTADNANTIAAIQAQKEAYLQRVQNLEVEVYGRTGYLTQIQNLQVILELKRINSPHGSSEIAGLEKELVKVMAERDSLKAVAEIVGRQIQEVEDTIDEVRKENQGLKEEKRAWEQERGSWESEVNQQFARNAELSLEVRTLEDTVRGSGGANANMSDAASDSLTYWREWARKLEEFVRTEPAEVGELYDLAHTYLPRLDENQQYLGVEWVQELINLVSDWPEAQEKLYTSSEQTASALEIAKRKIDELCEEVEKSKLETQTVTENRDWLRQLLAKEKQLAATSEELWKDKFEKEVDEGEAHAQEFVEKTEQLQSRLDDAQDTIRRMQEGQGAGEELKILKTDLYNALEECEDLQLKVEQATKDINEMKDTYEKRIKVADDRLREAISLKSDAEMKLGVAEEKLADTEIELQNLKASFVHQYPNLDAPPLNIQVRRAQKKVDMGVQESPVSDLSSPEVQTTKRRDTDASWVESDTSPIESPVKKSSENTRRSGRTTRTANVRYADADVVPKVRGGRKRKSEVEKDKGEKRSRRKT
ncbi:hypothetical protein ACMFMF_005592 [Clarireedia jacksonii]